MPRYEVYVRKTYSVEASNATEARQKLWNDDDGAEYLGREVEDEVYNVTEDKYE